MRLKLAGAVLVVMGLSACGSPGLMVAPGATPVVQSQSLLGLFGWWGDNGKARALNTFSKEEGRQITLVQDERGARLQAKLAPTEADVLSRVLTLGVAGQKKIASKDLIDGLYRRSVRHLKLMRRQKLTQDSSLTISFAKIVDDQKLLAFSVASQKGYQAFYTDKGRLLVSFVTGAGTASLTIPAEDNEPEE